jgi:glycosyltransferase involved in cell wall biosynthesis
MPVAPSADIGITEGEGSCTMKVLALVAGPYDTAPGQRYRIEQWEPILRRQGIELTFHGFATPELLTVIYRYGQFWEKSRLLVQAFRRRMELLASISQYDLVYILREAALFGPPIIERRIARAGVPIVYDFDDAIFFPYVSTVNGYLSLLKFGASKTRAICRLAAHVMTGNAYLAAYARQHNQNVTIVPTTIDAEKYKRQPKTPSDPPVIGWTGSHSTVQHLNTVRGVLQKLAQRERFRLRVIGAPDYRLDGVETEALPWRSETEVADLRPLDIGIMPLPDDNWSRGKCAAKALQYMGLAIPTVCSPVGVNSSIIQDGCNGFLAATEQEWIEKLSTLLHSRELRTRIGHAGRETVEREFCATVQAPRVAEIFRAVAGRAEMAVSASSAAVS